MPFTTPAYFGCLKAPLTRSDLERFFFIDGDRSWYPQPCFFFGQIQYTSGTCTMSKLCEKPLLFSGFRLSRSFQIGTFGQLSPLSLLYCYWTSRLTSPSAKQRPVPVLDRHPFPRRLIPRITHSCSRSYQSVDTFGQFLHKATIVAEEANSLHTDVNSVLAYIISEVWIEVRLKYGQKTSENSKQK